MGFFDDMSHQFARGRALYMGMSLLAEEQVSPILQTWTSWFIWWFAAWLTFAVALAILRCLCFEASRNWLSGVIYQCTVYLVVSVRWLLVGLWKLISWNAL